MYIYIEREVDVHIYNVYIYICTYIHVRFRDVFTKCMYIQYAMHISTDSLCLKKTITFTQSVLFIAIELSTKVGV